LDREKIIVLKKTVYRDADLIIRGLNAQGTRLSFIAPAALKSRKRFGGGVLEPTNYIEVVYRPLPTSSPVSHSSVSASATTHSSPLPRLLEAQILKEFPGLRRSYDLIQAGLQLVELVDRVSHDGLPHGTDLFNLLGHGLQCLDQINENTLVLFRLQFLLKFLFQQGVLDQQDWMKSFLQTPLKDHGALAHAIQTEAQVSTELPHFLLDQLAFVETQIKTYRETGSLT